MNSQFSHHPVQNAGRVRWVSPAWPAASIAVEQLSLVTPQTSICIHQHLEALGVTTGPINQNKHVELSIIDESERLNAIALEVL